MRCNKCHVFKEEDEFGMYKARGGAMVHRKTCIECFTAQKKQYYLDSIKLKGEKRCTKCQEVLPVDQFRTRATRGGGRATVSWCKVCSDIAVAESKEKRRKLQLKKLDKEEKKMTLPKKFLERGTIRYEGYRKL